MSVTLEDVCRVPVRFSEIDSMRRVWHGSFVTYFEDGRESFGRHYPGIGYADMCRSGIYAPIYEIKVRYYAPLLINEVAEIHTSYVYKPGARLDYDYRIYRESDHTLCAEGHTNRTIRKSGSIGFGHARSVINGRSCSSACGCIPMW